jgi:hypothetical protein
METWFRRHRLWVLAAVFAFAGVVRWLTLAGLGGDDHWSLWTAAVFLQGDTWFDGFVDTGDPLYWLMSAGAQWAVGYRVIGEVLLGITLVAVAITLSFDMAWEASRSWVVAAVMALCVVALASATEIYSHPKIFVYPLGAWLSWRYIDKPTRLRAVWLALGVAVAFGYRHDHGAYVGVGSMVAVVAAHWQEGRQAVLLSAGRLVLTGTVILAPFFVLVQWHEGLIAYFSERIEFASQLDEAGRRAVPWVVDASRPSFWLGAMPPPSARVAVEWASELTTLEREQLEERYSLSGGVNPETGRRSYRLLDISDTNVWALMSNPRANQIDGIEGSFRRAWQMKDGSEGEFLTIVWADGVVDDERLRLESLHRLVRTGDDTAMRYEVLDRSQENITALMHSEAIGIAMGTVPVIRPVVAQLRWPPDPPPRVNIRWIQGLPQDQRVEAERRYQLVNRVLETDDRRGVTYLYSAPDWSDENITALVNDDRVEDTGRIIAGAIEGTYVVSGDKPLPGATLSILWAPDVTQEERLTLEERYTLVSANVTGGLWEYTLTDTSLENIQVLLRDARVDRTSGIDRERLRPENESWWTSVGRDVSVFRVAVLPQIVHAQNAGVWLYYVVNALPWLVLVLVGRDWYSRRTRVGMSLEVPKMVTLAVMMVVAHYALMRKLGYFADHADVAMIFGAWCVGRTFGIGQEPDGKCVRRWGWRMVLPVTVTAGVLMLSTMAMLSYINVPNIMSYTQLSRGPSAVWAVSAAKFATWSTAPPIDTYAPVDATGDRALIRYFYECTTPADRLWVLSDMYTTPYYAERRVLRHIWWGNGFQHSPESQQRTIQLLEREPVPLIVGVGGAKPLQYLQEYDELHAYASERYREVHPILQDNLHREGAVIWLSVDSRRTPTRTYERLGLPCFA